MSPFWAMKRDFTHFCKLWLCYLASFINQCGDYELVTSFEVLTFSYLNEIYIANMRQGLLLLIVLHISNAVNGQIMCDALEFLPLHLIDSTVKRIEIEYHTKVYASNKVVMYVDAAGLKKVRIDDHCFSRIDEGVGKGWLIDTAGLPNKDIGASTLGFRVDKVFNETGYTFKVQYLNNFYLSDAKFIYAIAELNEDYPVQLPQQNLVSKIGKYSNDNYGFQVYGYDGLLHRSYQGFYLPYLFTTARHTWQRLSLNREEAKEFSELPIHMSPVLSESPYMSTCIYQKYAQKGGLPLETDTAWARYLKQLTLKPVKYSVGGLQGDSELNSDDSVLEKGLSMQESWFHCHRKSVITPIKIIATKGAKLQIVDTFNPIIVIEKPYDDAVGILNFGRPERRWNTFVSLEATAYGVVRIPVKRIARHTSKDMIELISTEVSFSGPEQPSVSQIKVSSLLGVGKSPILTATITRR